jgi:4-amino-4-deoxy-L-arabinose transferase-like glycosyltransferase
LLFAAIAVPWFAAMQARYPGFLDYFFVVQHFKRFAAAGFNNVMPFWFYPALLALATLPWWPWWPRVFRRAAAPDPEQGALRLLMALWLVVVVLFFSLPASKLIGYALPAIPALAYLLADGYSTLAAPSRWQARLWRAGGAIGCVVSVAAVVFITLHGTASSREVARALAGQRAPTEPVVMLSHYEFDLPFYARLASPVSIVDNWADPDIARHDNWRKEIADAGHFDPARARALLLQPAALNAALCHAAISWVVGSPSLVSTYPFLREAREIAHDEHAALWKVDSTSPAAAAALGCQTNAPRGDPPV